MTDPSIDPSISTDAAHRDWVVREFVGTAAQFHAMDLGHQRAVWTCRVTSPALVLGSTQSMDVVDPHEASRRGLEIARRRSGGGVVFVHPEDTTWIDVTIPRDDRLWVDDVSRAGLWLGGALVGALGDSIDARVHDGAFSVGDIGRTVCFASLAAGEVVAGGVKVVGVSQRRTREGARFQCILYRKWNPEMWSPALVGADIIERTKRLEVATVDMTPERLSTAMIQALSA